MTIFLVAGPPGIGKSTNGLELIPAGIPIIDQDLAAYQYKKQGFNNYQDIATLSTNQRIRELLLNKQSFALELNLGFESHYAYLRSIAGFDHSNVIHLLLFFTDDVNLCLTRAHIRFLSGGHQVKPEIIEEMYQHTIPLFFQNQSLFSQVSLIDVTYNALAELTADTNPLPNWVMQNNLQLYLTSSSQ